MRILWDTFNLTKQVMKKLKYPINLIYSLLTMELFIKENEILKGFDTGMENKYEVMVHNMKDNEKIIIVVVKMCFNKVSLKETHL